MQNDPNNVPTASSSTATCTYAEVIDTFAWATASRTSASVRPTGTECEMNVCWPWWIALLWVTTFWSFLREFSPLGPMPVPTWQPRTVVSPRAKRCSVAVYLEFPKPRVLRPRTVRVFTRLNSVEAHGNGLTGATSPIPIGPPRAEPSSNLYSFFGLRD